jgi:hypothetical protein
MGYSHNRLHVRGMGLGRLVCPIGSQVARLAMLERLPLLNLPLPISWVEMFGSISSPHSQVRTLEFVKSRISYLPFLSGRFLPPYPILP